MAATASIAYALGAGGEHVGYADSALVVLIATAQMAFAVTLIAASPGSRTDDRGRRALAHLRTLSLVGVAGTVAIFAISLVAPGATGATAVDPSAIDGAGLAAIGEVVRSLALVTLAVVLLGLYQVVGRPAAG